jgi:hypothetical protein
MSVSSCAYVYGDDESIGGMSESDTVDCSMKNTYKILLFSILGCIIFQLFLYLTRNLIPWDDVRHYFGIVQEVNWIEDKHSPILDDLLMWENIEGLWVWDMELIVQETTPYVNSDEGKIEHAKINLWGEYGDSYSVYITQSFDIFDRVDMESILKRNIEWTQPEALTELEVYEPIIWAGNISDYALCVLNQNDLDTVCYVYYVHSDRFEDFFIDIHGEISKDDVSQAVNQILSARK